MSIQNCARYSKLIHLSKGFKDQKSTPQNKANLRGKLTSLIQNSYFNIEDVSQDVLQISLENSFWV